jgi:hypothetical protein
MALIVAIAAAMRTRSVGASPRNRRSEPAESNWRGTPFTITVETGRCQRRRSPRPTSLISPTAERSVRKM